MKNKIKSGIKIDGVIAEELMKGEEPPKDEIEYLAQAKGFIPTVKQKIKHFGGKIFVLCQQLFLWGLLEVLPIVW